MQVTHRPYVELERYTMRFAYVLIKVITEYWPLALAWFEIFFGNSLCEDDMVIQYTRNWDLRNQFLGDFTIHNKVNSCVCDSVIVKVHLFLELGQDVVDGTSLGHQKL